METGQKPRLFIACAKTNLRIAHAIQAALEPAVLVTLFRQGVFGLSQYPMPALLERSRATDFAIMLFGFDEIRPSGEGKAAMFPNANVLIELGMFVAALGMERVFIAVPSSVRGHLTLPSDLNGITVSYYDPDREDRNLDAAVGTLAHEVVREIERLWPERQKWSVDRATVKPFNQAGQDIGDALARSSRLWTGYIHSRRFRENHGDQIRSRLVDGGLRDIRFFLPDIRSEELVGFLTSRFDDGPSIPAMIYDAFAWTIDLMKLASKGSSIAVRLYRHLSAYSFYVFDDVGLLAPYQLATVRKPVPTIVSNAGDVTWAFLMRDIEDYEGECPLILQPQLVDAAEAFAERHHISRS